MKTSLKALFIATTIFSCSTVIAQSITSEIHLLNSNSKNNGIGGNIGTITFSSSPQGLIIKTNLKGLPSGFHGFHIHQNPSCDFALKNKKEVPGLAAGGHLDPHHTHKHYGPNALGHTGDLPALFVNKKGVAKETLNAPNLTLAEIKGRSVMIHLHGDNYRDQPQKLGGGGPRIACGVIK